MSKPLLSRCARATFTLALLLPVFPLPAELPPLISRDVLFGNPERAAPKLSPDGQRLAWLAPDKKNVLQVWVKTVGKDDDKMVTADKKRGIRQYFWAEDNRTLLYQQDNDGDENFHVFGVDLASGNVRDFTPFQGVRAGVADLNRDFPDEVLIEANIRNRQLMDVHRLNLKTGALTLDTENPGDVSGWGTDAKFQVRAAQVATPDGGTEIRVRDDVKAPWKTLLKVGPDEILDFEDFSLDGKSALPQELHRQRHGAPRRAQSRDGRREGARRLARSRRGPGRDPPEDARRAGRVLRSGAAVVEGARSVRPGGLRRHPEAPRGRLRDREPHHGRRRLARRASRRTAARSPGTSGIARRRRGRFSSPRSRSSRASRSPR